MSRYEWGATPKKAEFDKDVWKIDILRSIRDKSFSTPTSVLLAQAHEHDVPEVEILSVLLASYTDDAFSNAYWNKVKDQSQLNGGI